MTTTLTRPETEYSHLGSAQMAGGRSCQGCYQERHLFELFPPGAGSTSVRAQG